MLTICPPSSPFLSLSHECRRGVCGRVLQSWVVLKHVRQINRRRLASRVFAAWKQCTRVGAGICRLKICLVYKVKEISSSLQSFTPPCVFPS